MITRSAYITLVVLGLFETADIIHTEYSREYDVYGGPYKENQRQFFYKKLYADDK